MHEILERLRVAIRARGGDNGFRTLTRILKRMDSSGDGSVRASVRCCVCVGHKSWCESWCVTGFNVLLFMLLDASPVISRGVRRRLA